MAVLTREQLAASLRRAGFNEEATRVMVAIALAESGGDTNATANTTREYSVGPWQINLHAHGSWVTESCARDPDCAARAAYAISESGTKFTPWSVFTNRMYERFLDWAGLNPKDSPTMIDPSDPNAPNLPGGGTVTPGTPVKVDDPLQGIADRLRDALAGVTGISDDTVKAALIGGTAALVGVAFVVAGLIGIALKSDTVKSVPGTAATLAVGNYGGAIARTGRAVAKDAGKAGRATRRVSRGAGVTQ